ncbi:hypothetical protein TNCV_2979091 [Trichonephila clavipes]|nr:hypothetical protein TNCV_2979091 [Trichonephila clavipes]
MRILGDGSSDFEPWSRDEDETSAGTVPHLSNFYTRRRQPFSCGVPNQSTDMIQHTTLRDLFKTVRFLSLLRWCGVVVRREGCQLRSRPRHLTMVQNYVVCRQKLSCS